jgi:hypothetical protein
MITLAHSGSKCLETVLSLLREELVKALEHSIRETLQLGKIMQTA